ncbi:acyltransferase family protein [Sutcliffiella horikoshii]|uniref:acyltransferase family protein n=1 Tax=Sutcliffiella horikoshii TaxID=79883 RepID=UPI001CFD7B14|nr:acyltransferase family protein [Sutcliffiella horikoshii]
MKNLNTDKNHTLDLLKGILIILVVLGHALEYGIGKYLIYYVHMPLFLCLFGILINKEKMNLLYLIRRLKRLIIPFFTASIIYFIFWSNFDFSIRNFIFIFITPSYHLWFLYSVSFHFILIYILSHFKTKVIFTLLPFILIISIAIQHYIPYYYYFEAKRSLGWFIFTLIGFILTNFYKEVIKRKIALISLFAFFLLSLLKIYLDFKTQDFHFSSFSVFDENVFSSALFIINNIFLIIGFTWFCFEKTTLNLKFINYLGKNSLLIYLYHILFMQLFQEIGISNALLLTILSIKGSIIIIMLTKRFKTFSLLIKGS